MQCPLSKEELALWKRDPLNSKVLRVLEAYRQSLQQQLAKGAFLRMASLEETGLSVARQVGRCEGISEILDMEAEERSESQDGE